MNRRQFLKGLFAAAGAVAAAPLLAAPQPTPRLLNPKARRLGMTDLQTAMLKHRITHWDATPGQECITVDSGWADGHAHPGFFDDDCIYLSRTT